MVDAVNRTTLEIARSVSPEGLSTEDWLYPLLAGVADALARVPANERVIVGEVLREMTTAEKDANVAVYIAACKARLRDAVNQYGEEHYPNDVEFRLYFRINEAARKGLTNRETHIQTAISWSDTVIAEWVGRNIALSAATTYAEAMAVSLDFSSFDASDPGVTVSSALAITD